VSVVEDEKVNESVKEVGDIGRFVQRIGIREVRLLPYHRLGIGKYEPLGMEYLHKSWDRRIDPEKLNFIKEDLSSLGLKITIEG